MRFLFPDGDDGQSIWRDLDSGAAGWVPRLALSLVAGVAVFAVGLAALAVISAIASHRTYMPVVLIALFLGGFGAWCYVLWRIWVGCPRFRLLQRAIFAIVITWGVVVPLCVLVESAFGGFEEDALIVACLVGATAWSIWVVTLAGYYHMRGKSMVRSTGEANLTCPECGYSMVGLGESRCPECGKHYTLDELFLRQEYGAAEGPNADDGTPRVSDASTRDSTDSHPMVTGLNAGS